MPFVKRDKNNHIISIHEKADNSDDEFLDIHHQEVIDFLKRTTNNNEENKSNQKVALSQSDFELIRVLEDLIDLLVDNDTILFTDLPEAAQNKLLKRKSTRKELYQSLLDDEDDNIF